MFQTLLQRAESYPLRGIASCGGQRDWAAGMKGARKQVQGRLDAGFLHDADELILNSFNFMNC
jgi:hypothetical protein